MNVEQQVVECIKQQVGHDHVELSSSLVADLGCDSLDIIEIQMAIEDTFEFEMSDAEAESVRTVQDIVNVVTEKNSK